MLKHHLSLRYNLSTIKARIKSNSSCLCTMIMAHAIKVYDANQPTAMTSYKLLAKTPDTTLQLIRNGLFNSSCKKPGCTSRNAEKLISFLNSRAWFGSQHVEGGENDIIMMFILHSNVPLIRILIK